MIVVKYNAVIGRETRLFVWAQRQFPGCEFSFANHSAVFNHDHRTTEFRHTTVYTTVVDPSQGYC